MAEHRRQRLARRGWNWRWSRQGGRRRTARCRSLAALGMTIALGMTVALGMTIARGMTMSWRPHESHGAVGGDVPCADRVVVVVRARAAHANEFGECRLDVARFVDRAAHEARRLAIPLPHVLKAHVSL